MPALYLFNRRTLLAGDDLQLPSLAWGAMSAAQLFIFLPYLLYYTIEILLTSPQSKSAYDGDAPGTWRGGYAAGIGTAGRRLSNSDDGDYLGSIKDYLSRNGMQSPACDAFTSDYADLAFPRLALVYLIGIATYSTLSLWYERRIFWLSSLGTPTRGVELRAPLGGLIESKMTHLAGLNFFLMLFGSACVYVFIGGYAQCFPTPWWITWILLLVTQALQCFLIFTTLISLWRVKPLAAPAASLPPHPAAGAESGSDFYRRHVDGLHTHDNIEIAEEIWRSRCEGCCRALAVSTCFLFGGRGIVSRAAEGGGEEFYGDIARALADYFADFGEGSDAGERGLDVVPSDVGLGFVMLRHIQAQRKMLAQRDALRQANSCGDLPPASKNNNALALLKSSSSTRENGNGSSLSPDRTTLLFRRSTQQCVEGRMEGRGGNSMTNHPAAAVASPTEDEAYTSFSRAVLSPADPDDRALLEEGARLARHQLAIYTWILYYYQFPLTGTLRLMGRALRTKLLKCDNVANSPAVNKNMCQNVYKGGINDYEPCSDVELGVCGSDTAAGMNSENIVGDNFLHIHEATMLAHIGLEKSDIAYASFGAGFYETPYCIIIDRKLRTVVLSIRGSLTLEDCLVDVLLDPSPLDALGCKYGFRGEGQYCHGGVLECTNWLHEDLMRHKVLPKLLLGEHAEFPGYTLHVVGHSLGAGIGVMLSLMLRNTYPNLRCICYSPPGGLLTWDLATECSEFVNSFVLDSDIVPRLSIKNMERLRDEVLHLISRVKLSKYEIARRVLWRGVCGEVGLGDLDFLAQQNEDMLHPRNRGPDSNFERQLRRFEAAQRGRRSGRGRARSVSLYPPGRITHLVKTGQVRGCLHGLAATVTCGASNAGSQYTPIRKENDDFNEIEVSPTLWTDHFPNRVCIEIERVANRFGIDTTLGSSPDC